jgi:hypothetical protein
MIQLKSVFPFTKSFFLNGKDYIFKAFETKTVGDDFINKDGTIKFPGLELASTFNDLGQPQDIKRPNGRQEYVFTFEKDGKVHETTQIKEFCRKNQLNHTSIRIYIKSGALYKGWKVGRRKFTEKEQELFEQGIPFALWKLKLQQMEHDNK